MAVQPTVQGVLKANVVYFFKDLCIQEFLFHDFFRVADRVLSE